jgi:acetyl esterase/lipase
VRIKSNGYILNTASGTQKGVCLNRHNAYDSGNHYSIVATGDFNATEALEILSGYFAKHTTITYRVEDAAGNLLEEFKTAGVVGDVINEVPDDVVPRAYTTYAVAEPVTLVKGKGNVVRIVASWNLPFKLSPDLNNAHWYNLALNSGADYVTTDNGYKCNPMPTKEDTEKLSYQWAFKGDPYNGIIVYSRTDTTKTLAKVGNKAILDAKVYKWKIVENEKGFLLVNNEDGKHINEYGGSGGYLSFYTVADGGSIFTVSKVGSLAVTNVKLSSGAAIKIFKSSEEKANGRAILIIPGGGYAFIAGSTEGADWAPFFNKLGYTAAVLTYTVPPTTHSAPMNQAKSAMKYLRDNAEEYNVTTGQVGVIGFSAGGHLAATVSTQTTGADKPAFQILFYPVITMDASYTHSGSRSCLIGSSAAPSLTNKYSNEKQVKADNPMAYICWADDDDIVPPRNSIEYVNALKAKGVPVHAKNFPTGGHGYGFKPSYKYHNEMIEDLTERMNSIDSILTSIDTPADDEIKDEACYDLNGRPVKKAKRGIFIKKGRKYFVK